MGSSSSLKVFWRWCQRAIAGLQSHVPGHNARRPLLPLLVVLCAVMPAVRCLGDDFEAGRAAANRREFATAYAMWRPLADRGDSRAQLALGKMFARGDGVAKDYKIARQYFKLAAEQGSAQGQFNLGKMLYYGDGGPQDYNGAYELFQRASRGGVDEANGFLRKLSGKVTPRTPSASASALAVTAASVTPAGTAPPAITTAQITATAAEPTPPLDLMAPEGSPATSETAATAPADPLAPYRSTIARSAGGATTRAFRFDPVAEAIIRNFPGGADLIPSYESSLFKGALINNDHELASHLALAEGGNAESQSVMGFAAQYAGNSEIAKSWFVKAAAQGDAKALFALGNLEFENNYERASELYTKAADAGIVPAQRNVGYFLLRGIGVDQNKERGRVFLDKASKAGDALATDLLK